jgi:hypothetical protein
MRSWDRLGFGDPVALELGPDASEGRKRPVVIQREPDDILFLSDAEAREAAARVLKIDPAFTISAWIARSQLSKNAKLMIEGFRKAGITE